MRTQGLRISPTKGSTRSEVVGRDVVADVLQIQFGLDGEDDAHHLLRRVVASLAYLCSRCRPATRSSRCRLI
jgi:hypothetical protein